MNNINGEQIQRINIYFHADQICETFDVKTFSPYRLPDLKDLYKKVLSYMEKHGFDSCKLDNRFVSKHDLKSYVKKNDQEKIEKQVLEKIAQRKQIQNSMA